MSRLELEPLDKTVPNAYHGTSSENAQKIRKQGFRIEKKETSYLGDGVYFYEGSQELAWRWATEHFVDYSIFRAKIYLGRCLDLDTPEHCRILQVVRTVLMKRNVTDPESLADTFIINWYALEVEKKLDTVTWTRTKKSWKEIYPESRIHNSEPIICVRNLSKISELSIVDSGRAS